MFEHPENLRLKQKSPEVINMERQQHAGKVIDIIDYYTKLNFKITVP